MDSYLIGLVIVLALVIVVITTVKNQRDRKKLEKSLNESEIKPEKHQKDSM